MLSFLLYCRIPHPPRPDVLLRPGTVGMQGSMVIRLRPCVTLEHPPPRAILQRDEHYPCVSTGVPDRAGHFGRSCGPRGCGVQGGPGGRAGSEGGPASQTREEGR